MESRARGGAELKEREEGRTKKDGQGQWGETDGKVGGAKGAEIGAWEGVEIGEG